MLDLELANQIPLPWQTTQWRRLRLQLNDNQLAHGYMFSGPAGLGKAAFAKQFARLILCTTEDSKQACGSCKNCLLGKQGEHPDIVTIKPEEGARDIKIDQIRALANFLAKTSHAGGAKIALIDHAHQMNNSAANALLKTLEEPTPGSFLFLITDSPGSLSATIRSRCQKLQFQSPDFDQASEWLDQALDDEYDSVKLLAATNNRPLLALELAGNGNLNARDEFITNFCQVKQLQQPLQELVTKASKLGEATAIECMLETASTMVKALLKTNSDESKKGADTPSSDDLMIHPAVSELTSKLASGDKAKADLLLLSDFHRDSLDSWMQLQSSTNPNPQLILESLLWQWKNLPLSAG